MVAWHGVALPFFHCRLSFARFSCFPFVRFFFFSILLLRRFDLLLLQPLLLPSFVWRFFFLYLLSYGLMPKRKNESPNTCVCCMLYTYICIMCWVAQSSRLFSCVVYAVFLCTAMLLLPVLLPLLLPLHGQTFTINPQSYAFFCTVSVDSPLVFFFIFVFALLFVCAFFSESVLHLLVYGWETLAPYYNVYFCCWRWQCVGGNVMECEFDSHRTTDHHFSQFQPLQGCFDFFSLSILWFCGAKKSFTILWCIIIIYFH